MNIDSGVIKAKSITGDPNLGGVDFDNRLLQFFVNQFRRKYRKDLTSNKHALHRLRTACEHAKCTLTSHSAATIQIDSLFEGIDFDTSITRTRFEVLNEDLFYRINEVVVSAAKNYKSSIKEVLLVGGSSCIPRVQKLIKDYFIGKEFNQSIDPLSSGTLSKTNV